MRVDAHESENEIASVTALEACIGKTPAPINLKVIDHLDASALRWLAASSLVFAAFGAGGRLAVTLGGGQAGFAAGNALELLLPLASLDDPALVQQGDGFGSLFLVRGIGETLRINGRVTDIRDGTVHVTVAECYVHCAKAMIRSAFWSAMPIEPQANDLADLVAQSRFMALATMDDAGNVDLSPKGDPTGLLARWRNDQLHFADRPGNRRADSFRNVIAQPYVSLALLIPGSHDVAHVSGRAQLLQGGDLRQQFAVQGKVPALVTSVNAPAPRVKASMALKQAALWPSAVPPADIDPAKMLVAHVQLNKRKGVQAKIVGAVLSVPGLMQKGLEKDYKSNLY